MRGKLVDKAENKGKEEKSVNEERIRRITKIYYSNPGVQKVLLEFAQNREVVPRYFEGFGKRPDTLQYPSDVMSLVNKGATSFHASEETWKDPLKISSDMDKKEIDDLRLGWDLLIDIDSKYLDYSKIAVRLILEALEEDGIRNYKIKFSGSKGFHIIVAGKAFPKEIGGKETREMFPDWARAIAGYLISKIRPRYNKAVSELEIDFDALKERTKLKKEDVIEVICSECGRPSKKGTIASFECPDCKTKIQRKNVKLSERKLRCINCPGRLDLIDEKPYYYCEYCKLDNVKKDAEADKKVVYTSDAKMSNQNSSEFEEGIAGNKLAGLDLVFVAPRHLFRMPYSLHEKTALASIVLEKEELENFKPGDANPLNIKIKSFAPNNFEGEGTRLLERAIKWKSIEEEENEKVERRGYKKGYENVDIKGVSEDMFPRPIKKLLKGKLNDGKKRGLFILITFLRSAGFSPEYINNKIRDWNKLNESPLKEGYIKSQIDWHLKQKKKILPPNYDNESFYKDLGLLDEKPNVKNPIVEVVRKLRGKQKNN